jgi:integrase
MSKREAGWKGVVLDEKYYMLPYWFKPSYAEQFMEVWDKYMEEVADIPLRLRKHPYAFMNIYREPKGAIYSLDKFVAAHGRACERIGLKVEKRLGTTPHGHRHAYGRRLSEAGVDSPFIKKCMHHSTEKSQEVYTTKTTQQVLAALETGFQRMQSRNQ